MLVNLTMALTFGLQPFVALEEGDLHWNIARDLHGEQSPNILSELEFDSINGHAVGFAGDVVSPWYHNWQLWLEGSVAKVSVNRGTTVDSDYRGDDRGAPYSRSRSDIVGQRGLRYNGGLGLRYQFAPSHSLALVVGVYHLDQTLNFQRGTQVLASPNIYTENQVANLDRTLHEELDTDYASTWEGNFSGAIYEWQSGRWSHQWRAQYHRGRYYGEGRWNLRSDLQQPRSFSHYVNSTGLDYSWQIDFAMAQNWSANMQWLYRDWDSDAGVSVHFLSNGEIGATRFNQVGWRAKQWRFGITRTW